MARAQRGRLRQVRPKGPALRFRWNPEQVTESGGVGGWAEIARPKRRPISEWQGRPARMISFTLVLDRWEDRESVEPDIRTLKQMGQPRAPQKPPPELELDYGPIGGGGVTWVIDSLEWGAEHRNQALQRIYQEVSVTLREYVEADVTLTPTEKHKAKKGGRDRDGKGKSSGGATNRIYVVKAGDTLATIAAAKLGRASRWREIAKLNGLRDPNHLKVGQRLKLPEA